MIEIKHRTENPQPSKILLIGVGNAGVNLADHMTMQSLSVAKIIAANTDSHSLMSSIATEKLLLGNTAARGLGAGGDPEIGVRAAEESLEEIRTQVQGFSIVIVCAGLGGGTGSGAVPLIVRAAREAGAFVIALVTLPFSFEGKRRARQTEDTLVLLEKAANVLLCFENDKISEITQPGTGVEETFEKSDLVLGTCLESLVRMIELPGMMRLSLGDLTHLLAGRNPRCLFGAASSDTENRAFDAVGKALKCPLLERGRILSESRTVLVHIAGSDDLSLAEISVIMQEVEKYTDKDANLTLGIGIAHNAGRTLTVSILGCLSEPGEAHREPEQYPEAESTVEDKNIRRLPAEAPLPAGVHRSSRPAAPVTERAEQGEPGAAPAKKGTVRPKQEFLQFDSVNRGRFEKSEPTIVEGEDLDVPTFLRLKIKVK
ncbi:MAG: cell division protein FtsZ [Chthoniobacterales bacterium]